jgi:hypothetical protein
MIWGEVGPPRGSVVKEDILEQVVDDYLQFAGYFTTHNIRFKPSKDHPEYKSQLDSVASDVDVVGYNPNLTGHDRVIVVSCKAWQSGFDAPAILAQLRGDAKNPKRPRMLQFRELWIPKWAEAFVHEIERLTGTATFTYLLAVTRLKGDPSEWEPTKQYRAISVASHYGSCRSRRCGRMCSTR